MRTKLMRLSFFCVGLILLNTKTFSQDQNFYIFLCFGQSNMEGQGKIQPQDKIVDSRFRVMEAVNCSNLGRTKGQWYTAVPPLCRCYTGLSPAEYFGRTLIENLPDSIRVGIINVSVAGCAIELYNKNNYQDYVATAPDWMVNIINEYGGNPVGRLVEIAKLAQQDGVIKGILLHQGETNNGDNQWPAKVKGVYDSLLNDLGLSPGSIPLLAGEVVGADQGGICAGMNSIIATLPRTIANSYVISSKGCTDTTDNLHFNSAGYRTLGMRYGMKMLSLLGYDPNTYLESECSLPGGDWEIKADTLASNGKYVSVKTGLNSTAAAPAGTEGSISFPFTVYGDSIFYIYARLNCPNSSHDSYWIKMDDGEYVKFQASRTNGWQWLKLKSFNLSAGEHTFIVSYCEDGAKLDKICISSYDYTPAGTAKTALNICNVDTTATSVINIKERLDGYALEQNYPNPFNPSTTINFTISQRSFVTLKVYDDLGREVAKVFAEEMSPGRYTRQWNAEGMPSGTYFYRLEAGSYSESKKLILIK